MSQKVYSWKNIQIRYFPDSKAIFLKPNQKTKKDDFRLLKNKIETLMQIDSTKTLKDGVSLKLSDNSMSNIDELLRSMGAQGGEEIEDAASVAQKSAEDNINKEKEQMSISPVQQQQMPNQQMPQVPPQPQQPMESINFNKIYNLLYESTFMKTPKPKPKYNRKKKAKRTGEYWENLEKVSGKNRQQLTEDDVLSLRKKFSIKPKNSQRDEVLKSLDKAFDYFYDKISREKGPKFAEKFSEDYSRLDSLSKSDYTKEHSLERIGNPMQMDNQNLQSDSINGLNLMDFSGLLDDEESPHEHEKDEENDDEDTSYDNIDVEESTY